MMAAATPAMTPDAREMDTLNDADDLSGEVFVAVYLRARRAGRRRVGAW